MLFKNFKDEILLRGKDAGTTILSYILMEIIYNFLITWLLFNDIHDGNFHLVQVMESLGQNGEYT